LANSVFEEYYFRWFVFGRMRSFLPLWPAAALSGLVFMAHHVVLLSVYLPGQFWTLTVPFSLCIAVGGAMWAWLYAEPDRYTLRGSATRSSTPRSSSSAGT